MVFALICIIALVIIIAFFIGKNLDYSTPIWFFNKFEDTNVAVIVFVAFAAGIVFALLLLGISKFMKVSKEQNSVVSAGNSDSEGKRKPKKQFFHKSLARTHKKEGVEKDAGGEIVPTVSDEDGVERESDGE